ncbi:DUF2207 domain-containing protein [Chryseobacterium camelliae]|uniref:DUF2207 domain-containing protein n=1 Tax=Chryseobacterium camelliae TaxID=1265445 RepID=A0ABY7QS96_9FLAO|nr:DUF2207 domain-containing protein [Chryseobacterium camelliae]WBV61688.1 DUF2207 domain-containing protein [Chryseobacterium camelliae]
MMNKFLKLVFLLCFALGFAQEDNPLNEDFSGPERILSYHSDINVDTRSTLNVTEKIKVHSLGDKIQRGIFRTLHLSRNLNNRTQKVKYDIVSIKKNGEEENYHEEIEDGFLKIYIGNKDIILEPGNYEYEIQYKTENQIGFFDKYDELYWNVNGNYWDFPVDTISATINLPQGASILQNSCYTGFAGSTEKNCSSKILSDHSIEWSASGFQAYDGLTIAVGFQKGIMIPPPPPGFLEKFGIVIGGFLVFLGLLYYYISTWRKYGVDPEKPIAYPQFNAPNDLSPASLGYLKTETFKNKYITAALVNLAIKGYVQIIEKEDSGILGLFKSTIYTLKKLKPADENLPKEEKKLMDYLLPSSRETINFDGKYDSKIEQAVLNCKEAVKFQHDAFLNEGNNAKKLILPSLLITFVYLIGLFLSYRMFPEFEKVIIGIFLYGGLFIAFFIAVLLFKYFPGLFKIFLVFPLIVFVSIGIFIHKSSDFTIDNNFNICYIFIVLGFTSLVIYEFLIKRPSEEKLKVKSLIEGFQMYMGAAENEQLKFHNPPEMTPQVFEKYLPFAMVLGVDEIWGKKFDAMLSKMSTEYHHNWYVGSSLNHYAFASTLNSSLTNSVQSSSTQPSNNSSSGSGSGGGGFSGGGGGGGGGGGW